MTPNELPELIRERIGLPLDDLLANELCLAGLEHMDAADIVGELARRDTLDQAWQAVIRRLAIHETYFYREPQHLRLSTQILLPPRLARLPAGERIRVLSVGCSTGEEPYSIAIALREQFGERAGRLFEIHAGDLDQAALARARAGRYGPFAFRALPVPLRDRYFLPIDDRHWQIAEVIREQVRFTPFNVLSPTLPRGDPGQDLIFFRNVSLYFDRRTRERALRHLAQRLRPGGHLIVGAAETLANDLGLFELCEQEGIFFFRDRTWAGHDPGVASLPPRPPAPMVRPGPDRRRLPAIGRPSATLVRPPETSRSQTAILRTRAIAAAARAATATTDDRYQEVVALVRAECLDEALARLTPLCEGPEAMAEHLTLLSHILVERGDRARAATAAEQALADDPWCTDALLILARIDRSRGDDDSATERLRRALYTRPDHWRTHYQLAEIHRDAGRVDQARREFGIALRLATTNPSAEPYTGPLPLILSPRDIRHLCETQLSRLATATNRHGHHGA
ncbi:CheR family methyltransferase [Thioalkalicoccus limnaeus]|uniref:CheR family methyltransferase n=1 Tax=Thioalkalicoccus limnaeus TaxID=120681 RepID=A0ABV4BIR3_9GAMM